MPDNRAEVLRTIASDMERDASEFEGKPFNGRTVGELHGNLCAAIAALAKVIETLLPVPPSA
jgi:hypothetical protein